MVAFLVIPQWQGSGSARAMRLIDGADAIRGDLPAASTSVVEVPAEAGENQGSGVHRITALCAVRDSVHEALASLDEPVIVAGGDAGVELAPISSAILRGQGRTGVVWFGAHPDLHTPESSESHAFHGMVLRTLLGDGEDRLVPHPDARIDPSRLVLAGARAFDDPEAELVDARGLVVLAPGELEDPAGLIAALEASDVDSVYLHVDLDVLDPSEIDGIAFPEPFGVLLPHLLASITAIRERYPLAGAGITEFAPSSPDAAADDLSTILRIVSALTRPRT